MGKTKTRVARSRWNPPATRSKPRKGGDGGTLPQTRSGWRFNAREVLAGESLRGTAAWPAFEASLIATDDPCDRAHAIHRPEVDGAGRTITSGAERLLSAFELPVGNRGDLPGKPRRYPPSQLVRIGDRTVSIDSMFDGPAAAAGRLQAQGIPLGWPVIGASKRNAPPGRVPMCVRDLERLGMDRDSLRRIAQPQTWVRLPPTEAAEEQRATEWLRRHEHMLPTVPDRGRPADARRPL